MHPQIGIVTKNTVLNVINYLFAKEVLIEKGHKMDRFKKDRVTEI